MDASALVALPVNAPGVDAFTLKADLIWLLRQLVIFGLPLAYFFSGFSARFRDRVAVWTSGVYQFTVILFAFISVAVVTLLSLPVSYWLEIALQPPGWQPSITSWLFVNLVRGFYAFLYVTGAALVLPFLTLLSPKRWWVIVAVFAIPVLVLNISRENNMPPQPDARDLQINSDTLTTLFKRCKVRNIPLFVGGELTGIDGSGADARVLLSATDAGELSDAQFLSKIAHELKHEIASDTLTTVGFATLLVSAGLFLIFSVGGAAARRFGPRLRVKGIEDIGVLPLLVGIAGLYWTFIGAPALNTVRRGNELDADRFALELTHANSAVAGMHAAAAGATTTAPPGRLVEYDPLHTYLRASVPSDVERVQLANTYKPWASGQPGKYADLCGAGPAVVTPAMEKGLAPDIPGEPFMEPAAKPAAK